MNKFWFINEYLQLPIQVIDLFNEFEIEEEEINLSNEPELSKSEPTFRKPPIISLNEINSMSPDMICDFFLYNLSSFEELG